MGFRRCRVLLVVFLLLQGGTASGGEGGGDPWRGSVLTWRNVGTALSLRKDAELTYNPYYAMELDLHPRWWFGSIVSVDAGASLSRELTDSDVTTQRGEIEWGDVSLGVSASRFYVVPVARLGLSAGLSVQLPTSKVSKARTLLVALKPSVRVERQFDVLDGAWVGYGFSATRFFNESTTSEREAPLIPDCLEAGSGCDAYLGMGVRNPEWRLAHGVDLGVDFARWLGISASASVLVDMLYPMTIDEQVSYEPQEGTERRYVMAYGLEAHTRPLRSLGFELGVSTVNPQLRPDSTPEKPFFNRYTLVYLDVQFHFGSLVSQLTSKEVEQ
ncbi:MAG: hypothetical protein FJ109_08695 [Deltaproteobacteria bacterium]|nr:hypothetical protein [Deltaproteobacteria bacterium]